MDLLSYFSPLPSFAPLFLAVTVTVTVDLKMSIFGVEFWRLEIGWYVWDTV